jgi:alanine racemase
VSTAWAVEEVATAARQVGRPAAVHVKVDTGLSRNGASTEQLPDVLRAAAAAADAGLLTIDAVWSHLAEGDTPDAPSVARQVERFDEACALADSLGIRPRLRHLGNSGSVWAHPQCRFDLVRVGIAMYGLTPSMALGSAADLGLTPAMTLTARLAHVKGIDEGESVGYAGTWSTPSPTAVGLVPLGYADGIPRAAGNRVEVAIGGVRRPIVGRVAMDQFVVDLGSGDAAQVGDVVHLFGSGAHGELTADEWGAALDTIGYEIVTRIGGRVARSYVGAP